MSRLYKFVALVILLILVSTEDDHDHDHDDDHSVVHEIFEHLNTTLKDGEGHSLLSVSDFDKLFKELNFRKCGTNEESNSCNLVRRFFYYKIIKCFRFRSKNFVCFFLICFGCVLCAKTKQKSLKWRAPLSLLVQLFIFLFLVFDSN